ncbi:MAG: FMN-dependent NADH-azoreductase [Roseateles sp.]|uniref:FMN-dependent NADH-azoreductase n=1 Tax=Roseateles sp. TaxID=1971397 RepID=UPI004036057F
MTRLLHIDSSARPGRAGEHPHGSHSRRLSHAFVNRWRAARPKDEVVYRDLAASEPTVVRHEWIPAAFTPEDRRTPAQHAVLRESDTLVRELKAAELLVIGMPMYNFGMPAPLKAWVDNIVRIAATFDFDPGRDNPYVPLLADRPRRAVLLTSRGGNGFDAGGPLAAMNHADTALRDVLGFLGITQVQTVAIEHEEAGGPALAASVARALSAVDALADAWLTA